MKPKLKTKLIYLLIVFCAVLISCKESTSGIKVSQKQFVYPVLKYKPYNHVLLLELQNKDSLKTITLNEITLAFDKQTALEDIKSVGLYYVGSKNSSIKKESKLFASSDKIDSTLKLSGNMQLSGAKHFFRVSLQLKDDADISNRLNVSVESIKINEGIVQLDPLEDPKNLRLGVAVRKHNDDGVHTYRIPGLVTSTKGTLIACYDVRRDTGRDLQGNIDIGISRSFDGGNTWEPMQIAMDMEGFGGLPEKFNGVSDACLLVDRNSGDIYLAGLWMHGVINKEGKWVEGLTEDSKEWNHQWKNKGSQPGFGLKQTSQFLISKSSDDGKTWSEPVNITKMCKKEKWWLFAPAPGNGITMEDGTLVFPTQGRDENGKPFSNITYSKDGGKTWITSNPAHNNTTECAVVELEPGVLMLNMRDNRNREDKSETNGRAVYVTSDMGENWEEHSSSHKLLPEPVCMASLFKFQNASDPILLFSNPNTKDGRYNITLKASFDYGKSWKKQHQILLDQGRGRGYSSITQIDEATIGILYEGSQADMIFQKIPVSEIAN